MYICIRHGCNKAQNNSNWRFDKLAYVGNTIQKDYFANHSMYFGCAPVEWLPRSVYSIWLLSCMFCREPLKVGHSSTLDDFGSSNSPATIG
eukprot:scaffold319133_cov23-Prasinocladus_malaysianus.AAC.1